jgi:hypothetical protein
MIDMSTERGSDESARKAGDSQSKKAVDAQSKEAQHSSPNSQDVPPLNDADIEFDKFDKFTRNFSSPIWQGWDGAVVMVGGVMLPALMLTVAGVVCFERICRLAFKHPIETLAECAFLVLIPIANYLTWHALAKNDYRKPLKTGIMNGAAIGTSAVTAVVVTASMFFGFPAEFGLIGLLSAVSCGCSLFLAYKLRQSAATSGAQNRRVAYSLVGVILSLIGLGAAEARGTAIRFSEYMAMSKTPHDQVVGIRWLRLLNCEQDLRMQCADERTAGVPGLFFRVSPQAERQLYFAVTGKPYGNSLTQSVYSMSDDYLRTHVVGEAQPGLTLLRSAINAYVHPETLTATTNWTFVFNNTTFYEQEARAEIAVPPGAVLSDLTLWAQGEPKSANFGPSDRVQGTYNSVNVSDRDPAVITDLGRGRVLLKCSPVPAGGQLKVNIAVTSRLKPDSLKEASLTLPKFINANFDVKDGEHNLRLHSPLPMELSLNDLRKQPSADGGYLIAGTLKDKDLFSAPLTVRAQRPATMGPIAVPDKTGASGGYVVATVEKIVARPPQNLLVVIDSSVSMKDNIEKISSSLKAIPKDVHTSVLLVSEGRQSEPLSVAEALDRFKNDKVAFDGGRDNLQAVVKAAELAGETKKGAVLWIHGPQPSFNQEIYIMAPFISKPRFYELALDDGFTDANEYFKNHREVGPFSPVPRSGALDDDLKRFLAKWEPGGIEYGLAMTRTAEKPKCKIMTNEEALELSKLCARDEAYQLMRDNRLIEAADIASMARLVTPVTSAAVFHQSIDASQLAENDPVHMAQQQGAFNGTIGPQSGDAVVAAGGPVLQGATNGTIGPLKGDATVIQGVNTAGTVRVNNLANLEALLNIMANGMELLGLLYGGGLALGGLAGKALTNPMRLSPVGRTIFGVAVAAGGLAIPGMINWLVASARDANLFS